MGRVFDNRYRIESLLGKGGMGAVYRATQIAMHQVVAIKVVKPEFAANAEAAKRFHREAKAASALSSPHTIRVFDFGQTHTRELYLAMEYLEGPSLGRAMRGAGHMPAARAVKIAAEIAASLAEAHERGLVHRDLKPENVILLPVGSDPDFVKVLDFGIAKFVSGSSGDSTVTRTGAVIGTPHYMAPEQARATRTLTGAADVYSLGVVLFEMLTGTLPFQGDSPVDVLMAHVNEPVPELPGELEVPPELRALLERMLAKRPEDRPTTSEVAATLDDLHKREIARDYLARQTPAPDARPTVAAMAPPARVQTATVQPVQVQAAEVYEVPESLELELPRRSRAFVLVVVGVAVVAMLGLALWLSSGRQTPDPAPPAVGQPKAAPERTTPAVKEVAKPEAVVPQLNPPSSPAPAPSTAPDPTPALPAPSIVAEPAPVVPVVVAPAPTRSAVTTPEPAKLPAARPAATKPPREKPVTPKPAPPKPEPERMPAVW